MATTSRTHRRSRVRARRGKKEAVQYRARDLAPVVDRPVRWGGAAGWLISAEVLLSELRMGEERAALAAAQAALLTNPGAHIMLDSVPPSKGEALDPFLMDPTRTGVDINDSPTVAALKPEHRAYFRAGDFGKDCAARDALKAAGVIAYDRKAKRWQVVA